MVNELLPFQKTAVAQMLTFLRESGGCYNACSMGLGKSIQAIACINSLACKTTLIICPAVMRLTWKEELIKWSETKAEDITVIQQERISSP